MTQYSNKSKLSPKVNTVLQYRERLMKVFALMLCVAFFGGWIIWKEFIQPPLPVLSLKGKWDSLEAYAHNMQGDAYLTYVDINLEKRWNPYPLEAVYYSPSVPDNMISVTLDASDQMSGVWMGTGAPETVSGWINFPHSTDGGLRPISRTDWIVDSQEALNIFAKNRIARSCLRGSGVKQMSLYQVDAGFPVWELDLWDCPKEGNEQFYYLDAQTGEVIDLSK